MTPFKLDLLPQDPIFGIDQAFKQDTRSDKVNLVMGSYRDEEGQPWTPLSLEQAEKRSEGRSKDYLPVEGDPLFLDAIKKLFFREDLVAFQTLGGAGALMLGGEIAKRGIEGATLYLPSPTWANHTPIFKKVGLKLANYPYPDFEKMIEMIEGLSSRDLFLLHLVCHNPTGIDPNLEQWERISMAFSKSGAVPFFDLAYLGFGGGVQEDLAPLKFFLERKIPFLLAFSCSKSFAVYGERVGALVVSLKVGKAELLSHGKQIIRTTYSNPPRFGATLVASVLSDPVLYKLWESDLLTMRRRLKDARTLFLSQLQVVLPEVEKGRGMFSLLPLQKGAVERLKNEHVIFIPDSGRISFAGITAKNCHVVTDALKPYLLSR